MKNYKRIKGSKIEKILVEFVTNHLKYKNTYHWNPPSSARGRRAMEFQVEFDFSFKFQGKHYDLEQSLDCSCSNIYWTSTIHVDGKKSTIRSIKKLLGVK